MPIINIQGNIISFPDSAQSPNWAPAMVQFAQAVEAALQSAVGSFDIAPQVYDISNAAITFTDIPALNFSTSAVQGVVVTYSSYRKSSTENYSEAGELHLAYNPTLGTWQLSRESTGQQTKSDGVTQVIEFSVTNAGQVQYKVSALGGTSYSGKLSFFAKALTQS